MDRLQAKLQALNLSINQNKELLFRINEIQLMLGFFDVLIPPVINHYVVLFADYPTIKYIKLKCKWDTVQNDRYSVKDMIELSEQEYEKEIAENRKRFINNMKRDKQN